EKTLPVIKIISDIRKTSITFAVEAGDENVRAKINKKLTIEELERILTDLFSGKWDTVKFYFMIGLPGFRETDEIDAIIAFLKRIDTLAKKKKTLNVTISPFIPKPFTPLEDAEMADDSYFRQVVSVLKDGPPRRISIKNHNIGSSVIEGLLARGDEEVGKIIESAYRKGAHLDSWDEFFRYGIWREACEEFGDVSGYFKARSPEELTWRRFTTGYERLIDKMKTCPSHKLSNPGIEKPLDTDAIAASFELFTKKYLCVKRARIRLTKTGAMKYISHLDFLDVVKRGLRILGMPVSYTQGFNKHERISAGFPLPLGIESEAELFEVDLYEDIDPASFISRFADAYPAGVEMKEISFVDVKGSLMASTHAFSYNVTPGDDQMRMAIRKGCQERAGFIKTNKEGKSKELTFDQVVRTWKEEGEFFTFFLNAATPESLRIDQVLIQLSGRDNALDTSRVLKTGQYSVADENCTLIS
ncbi:MAG: TIGR03936 family radical SAM-associated protein, partial [Spirochaetota bacterium]